MNPVNRAEPWGSNPPPGPPVVVFLHGVGRSRLALERMRRHVARAGFDTWAKSYPSTRAPLDTLANDLDKELQRDHPGKEFHAVTHSMGGIVLRHMATCWNRVVMIAPPNRGSRLARQLIQRPATRRAFEYIYGPSGHALARGGPWPELDAEVGVIAGTGGLTAHNPISWLSALMGVFAGIEHDGTVAIDETHLPGMHDFIAIDTSHTWILEKRRTWELVQAFLERGQFVESTGRD